MPPNVYRKMRSRGAVMVDTYMDTTRLKMPIQVGAKRKRPVTLIQGGRGVIQFSGLLAYESGKVDKRLSESGYRVFMGVKQSHCARCRVVGAPYPDRPPALLKGAYPRASDRCADSVRYHDMASLVRRCLCLCARVLSVVLYRCRVRLNNDTHSVPTQPT